MAPLARSINCRNLRLKNAVIVEAMSAGMRTCDICIALAYRNDLVIIDVIGVYIDGRFGQFLLIAS